MAISISKGSKSRKIREKLKHPVIDADGHVIEFGPTLFDAIKRVGGQSILDRFLKRLESAGWEAMTPEERLRRRVTRPSAWASPTRNTLDRATALMPRLLRARMDDFGLDFTIVYSTIALGLTREEDEEIRRVSCRAINLMFSELYREQADRMAPVAAIPAHTPQEAIEELEYAVKTLGLKAAMIASNVRRTIPIVEEKAPELGRFASWMDTLCMESPYDYDPLWAKCVELGVAVTSHSPSMGYGSRVVTNHYIHNHVGSFAAAGEAFAKAVVLGGVSKRFPTLNFGFLEGGVAWACELYAGLVGHCSKRNSSVIDNYDPKNIDYEGLADLFAEYGQNMVQGRPDPNSDVFRSPNAWRQKEDTLIAHELDNLGIKKAEDLRPLFEPNFYFGCEADDPLVSVAFDTRINPFGSRLKAMFSSDIGHWDVPDMTEVLEEAYELVERELIGESEFEEFVFKNAALLHGKMNPNFFKGTVVEADVAKVLAS